MVKTLLSVFFFFLFSGQGVFLENAENSAEGKNGVTILARFQMVRQKEGEEGEGELLFLTILCGRLEDDKSEED
jgi:hypothetical protein